MGCLNPGSTDVGKVGADYSSVMDAYTAGVPQLLRTERANKPQFINQGLASAQQGMYGSGNQAGMLDMYQQAMPGLQDTQRAALSGDRAATVGDVGTLGRSAASSIQGINPEQTGLMKSLSTQAQQGLDAGSNLDARDSYRITQGVRSDWANRGLGVSAPAQLDEAMNLYGGGEQLKAQRQGVASGVIGLQNQTVTQPALGLAAGQGLGTQAASGIFGSAAGFGQGAGPTLISGDQSYDAFNTIYNAQSASQIARANNTSAMVASGASY
ncbi:conserved hypothetical protein [Gammaproteobacteria bacterium]